MKSLHTKPENWITALVVILLLTASQVVIAKSAAGALKKMDRNGDGQLSYDEWRKKRIFKRIDLNGDTFLDVSELKRFFGEPLEGDLAQVLPDSKTISAIRRSKFDDPQDLK
ncbi:MAG: hypothetical protein KUF72_07370, partial [Candidatus Thiodiazotropha sp. (ex Ctena orbiculata)]|nr:hypothetical protein [Candidatus Thiodiazotropha taylori]